MKAKYTWWREPDGWYLGYLHEFPDHWTQGEDLKDLEAHLKDLYDTFTNEEIPGIHRVGEIEVS